MKWEVWLVHPLHDKNRCVKTCESESEADRYVEENPLAKTEETDSAIEHDPVIYRIIKIWE
jgi:hypothetical protein